MEIGRAMQKIREERGMSRKSIADSIGVTHGALWKIENGRVEPKRATIERFCSVMGIPLAYLYGRAMALDDYRVK